MRRLLTAIGAAVVLASSAAAGEALPPPSDAAPARIGEEFSRAVFFGRKFYQIGEYRAALEHLTKADALFPDQPALLYDLALVLARLDRTSDAQTKLDRYRALYPEGEERELVAGLERELAFQRELQRKQQEDHDYAELFNRGTFLLARGELEQALAVFAEAEQQRPEDAAVPYNQALAHRARNDFVRAMERYRRYLALAPLAADKPAVDQAIFDLEKELEETRTKIVCPFCGHKLDASATWCHRCWRGPWVVDSPVLNARPCGIGASATRTSTYTDGRVARNEELPCQLEGGSLRQVLRYEPARRAAIVAKRKEEGWSYEGDVLVGRESEGARIRLVQRDTLERVLSLDDGEVLSCESHRDPAAGWLLDREDVVIEGQKYSKHYSWDTSGRIVRERATWQAAEACDHIISVTADVSWEGARMRSIRFSGGYEGYEREGSPEVRWEAEATMTYDEHGRLTSEQWQLLSYQKTYLQRPEGEYRRLMSELYPGARPKKPIDVSRVGDRCGVAGTRVIGNPIDLRPFYSLSPNLALLVPFGVVRVTTSFTYPDGFRIEPAGAAPPPPALQRH